jgi:hypothetical protein
MRLLFAALLALAPAGCTSTSESFSESSTMNPDGSTTTTRVETKTRNGETTSRKTETVIHRGQVTKTVYEKKGAEWVKVE